MPATVPFFERPRRACCDGETFWSSFMQQWRKRFGRDADTPDFVCRPAFGYWRRGLTGFEAAETCHRRLMAGTL